MSMKTFVMIPTYNETDNIEHLIREILAIDSGLNIIVVDDSSPDGTVEIVKRLSQEFLQVNLLVRKRIRGRGSAGIDGFRYALSQGADYIIEMDADFSHHPKYIPLLLEKIKDCDVVLGSRFVKGGKDMRGIVRHMITVFANAFIRHTLKIHIRDCTSGYRCFRREVLEKIKLDNTVSLGPSVVQEVLYKAVLNGFRIIEVPIVFTDRKRGNSTFNFKIMLQGFLMVLILRYLFSHLRKEEIHEHEK